jgi:predicted transcriptional regulator
MKRTPCEYIVWNILPAIRSEIARSMINDFGLNQKDTAAKLGITPAAVCLYLSDKRGSGKIKDKKIIKKIHDSTENLIKNKNSDLIKEICEICRIIKSKNLFIFLDSKSSNEIGNLL